MNNKLLKWVLFSIVFMAIGIVYSQNPSAPNRTPPPPPGIPIDGGILTLISVGIGYAWKKFRDKNNLF